MKVLIAGPGAVGTYVGGKLALSGVEVIFYSRRPDYCDWMTRYGIAFRENGLDFRVKVKAYSELSQLFASTTSLRIFDWA